MISASSALRCRVSSIARARESAAPTCWPDEREQLLVLLAVANVLRVRLHDEDADRPPLGLERDAEPARVLRDGSDELDLALLDQLLVPLVRDQLRLAGPERVARHPARLPLPNSIHSFASGHSSSSSSTQYGKLISCRSSS